MRAILGKTIFSVEGPDFLWADVVLAAELRGEWAPVVQRAMEVLAALEREANADEELVEDSEIEEESNRFRYARELVSVDDTERWLSGFGLDIDTWLTWIRAGLLRKRFEAEGTPVEAPTDAAEIDAELADAMVHAEAVCSGALSRFARKLAADVAIARKLAEDGAAEEPSEAPEPPVVDLASLPSGFPEEGLDERVRVLSAYGRTFDAFRGRVVTPEAVAGRVRAHQGDWMRVDCRILTVKTEDVAREALLSIQEDGEDMAEVAGGAGAEVREGTFYLEELDRVYSDRVLAARKGELLGPFRTAEGWTLVELVDKRLATVDDDEIRARAEESLFDSVVEREMDNRVKWRWDR